MTEILISFKNYDSIYEGEEKELTTTGLMQTFYPIRKATRYDLSRIAEIYVFNNRINYFPIFNDESFSFGKLQVISLADQYFGDEEVLKNLYVY